MHSRLSRICAVGSHPYAELSNVQIVVIPDPSNELKWLELADLTEARYLPVTRGDFGLTSSCVGLRPWWQFFG